MGKPDLDQARVKEPTSSSCSASNLRSIQKLSRRKFKKFRHKDRCLRQTVLLKNTIQLLKSFDSRHSEEFGLKSSASHDSRDIEEILKNFYLPPLLSPNFDDVDTSPKINTESIEQQSLLTESHISVSYEDPLITSPFTMQAELTCASNDETDFADPNNSPVESSNETSVSNVQSIETDKTSSEKDKAESDENLSINLQLKELQESRSNLWSFYRPFGPSQYAEFGPEDLEADGSFDSLSPQFYPKYCPAIIRSCC